MYFGSDQEDDDLGLDTGEQQSKYKEKEMRRSRSESVSKGGCNLRKIFVGGLSKTETDSASFSQFFENFGELDDIILMRSKDRSGHRGFGFVTFKEQKVTDLVLSKAGELELDGAQITVKTALPAELRPPEGAEGNKIFIGSLPKENFDKDDLKKYFSKWGAIKASWIGRGRGFGFITYENCNGAYKAMMQGANESHVIGDCKVNVKWPTP